jgi:hypothetical protein
MKLRTLCGAIFLAMAFILTSCEELSGCKICRQVTYVNGIVEQESRETEYCGAELIAIEATADIVSGNTRIAWECR